MPGYCPHLQPRRPPCRVLHSTLSLTACCVHRYDITTNLFFDSYGGSTISYTNCKVVNPPAPAGATVRRSAPATEIVQGWGYPATASWYYLGYDQNGQDARPSCSGCVTQQSADPNDLQPWW